MTVDRSFSLSVYRAAIIGRLDAIMNDTSVNVLAFGRSFRAAICELEGAAAPTDDLVLKLAYHVRDEFSLWDGESPCPESLGSAVEMMMSELEGVVGLSDADVPSWVHAYSVENVRAGV